jgi:hypothetical protein
VCWDTAGAVKDFELLSGALEKSRDTTTLPMAEGCGKLGGHVEARATGGAKRKPPLCLVANPESVEVRTETGKPAKQGLPVDLSTSVRSSFAATRAHLTLTSFRNLSSRASNPQRPPQIASGAMLGGRYHLRLLAAPCRLASAACPTLLGRRMSRARQVTCAARTFCERIQMASPSPFVAWGVTKDLAPLLTTILEQEGLLRPYPSGAGQRARRLGRDTRAGVDAAQGQNCVSRTRRPSICRSG